IYCLKVDVLQSNFKSCYSLFIGCIRLCADKILSCFLLCLLDILYSSSEHDTALVAALDGTIHLMELKSTKVIWSLASGPSIYSSYQAPVNHDNDKENASGARGGYFVDCGDDWKLYAHSELGKVNLDMTAEEFLSITPHITDDGGVVLGSKKTTVFLVDAKTGRLLHTYSLFDSSSTSWSNVESSALFNKSVEEWEKSGSANLRTDERPLYITRTDYLLKSYAPNSDKVLWNVTVSDIGAAFLCTDVEDLISGAPGYELPSEPGARFNMPLPCQSKAVVFRLRSPNMLESLTKPGRLPEGHHEKMLPMPPPTYMLPSRPTIVEFPDTNQNNEVEALVPMSPLTKNSGISGVQHVKMPYDGGYSMLSDGRSAWSLLFLLIAGGCFTYYYTLVAGKSTKQSSNLDPKTVSSRRKKNRKSGKSISIAENKDKQTSSDLEDGYSNGEGDRRPFLNFKQLTDGCADGRVIGKLFVSNTEIAKGSNGTIVLEGIYEGRPVAVKRLVKAHHDVAFKEIQNLIASDRHSNIVRWYGVEYDQDFVYLSLERCTCSLNDLIQMHSDFSERPSSSEGQSPKVMTEYKVQLDSIKSIMPDIELWKTNDYPSPILLNLMRDVVSGLVHLHDLGIIHRDLKPQNVLIIKERAMCAKLSDMGISKRLVEDMSSLSHHATGYGSSGWQAPEQLLHGRQTRAVDLFSLGCVLFFCITRGRHPFGDNLERDINIAKNRLDLFLVVHIPEAVDLFSRLLDHHAERRPKAIEVLLHPFFWSSELRLSFLRDTSDRVELEDRESDSGILKALEGIASVALGGKWDEKMEPAFIANIGRYRRYKFDSVRDLLRVMRNKLNHYRELPKEIQELLGPVPEGFYDYFASRFPKLLIEVYKVMHKYCKEEEWFQKYVNSSTV
ncbi:hypothetical protein RJ640_027783, partial [Escallonia rubra]